MTSTRWLHGFQGLGRTLALFLLTLFTLVLLPGCKTVSSLDGIREKGTLTIVTRNGPTTYYESRYGPTGFEYALAQEFARSIGVKLEIRTAYTLEDLFRTLENNQADIIAAGLTATEQRASQYRFSLPYFEAKQLILYRTGTKRPRKLEDIIDKDIRVLANSSHAERLAELAEDNPGLRWEETIELETLDLMEQIQKGELTHTIIDSNEFEAHKAYFPHVRIGFAITEPEPIAWVMARNPTDDDLYDAINNFMAEITESGKLESLKERFYGHTTHVDQGGSRTFSINMKRRLPKYEELIKQVAREEGMDWRLLAAISYQESHWNPRAKSPTGVRGMMMLTRPTASEMGVTNRLDPEQSLRGGARYFLKIRKRIPSKIKEPERTWLALAAYNVGMGHLNDARIITEQHNHDSTKWSDVMLHLPLLQKRKYYENTKYGYARGSEPVVYVQHIRHYYNLLSWEDIARARQKPPTQVATLLPEELRDMDSLSAL